MTNNIKKEIKRIITEYEEIEQDTNKIKKIYNEAWMFVLKQFKRSVNSEYYLLPLLFFTKYGENNKDNIDKAIELLKNDGFYIDEKSNIQALRIKRGKIMNFANSDTSTKIQITPFAKNRKRKWKRGRIMNENNTRNERLQTIYFKIWMFAMMQVESNKQGAYIWLLGKSKNNNLLYCHLDENLIKEEIEAINDDEMQEIIDLLKYDGFKIIKTKNNNLLITITRENIYKPVEKVTHR